MKKIVIWMLVMVMAFSLVACAGAPTDSYQKETQEEAGQTNDMEQTPTTEAVDKEEEAAEPEKTDKTGLRPEFKKAMDDYEAFYDKYCAFMKKYKANPTDMSLLTEYASMTSKLADMDASFKKWDQKEMSKEEVKYYLEVSSRITQKLVDIAA